VVTAGTVDKNQTLFVIALIAFAYQTGNFYRFNVKIFQHMFKIPWKLSITKAKFNAMEE